MGGGGFFTNETALDDYVLTLTGKITPRLCLLATASHDSRRFLAPFYRAFSGRARATHLGLFPPSVSDIGALLLAQDVIYVGGGNVGVLLRTWRTYGLEAPLRAAWEAGVVLCGPSAGGMCWFQGGISAAAGPAPSPMHQGLGMLDGSFCPHYEEPHRRSAYHRALTEGLPAGFGVESGAALHFIGDRVAAAVTSKPDARAYEVRVVDGAIEEAALDTRYLG